jgi:hypothetical protein
MIVPPGSGHPFVAAVPLGIRLLVADLVVRQVDGDGAGVCRSRSTRARRPRRWGWA